MGSTCAPAAWNGYNVCLFAYGQTGSGKSYSMVGYGAEEGMVPKACREIFTRLNAGNKGGRVAGPLDGGAQVEVTMIEIYNERVKDLLTPTAGNVSARGEGGGGGGGLKVRSHPVDGPYVEGLLPCAVRDYDEVARLMERGAQARTVAATAMNATSSRAHTIVELRVRRREADGTEVSSRMSLVDLAGSERSGTTGATGQRLKEGAAINKSLSALGNCIAALADRATGKGGGDGSKVMIPYRDSTLTLLLKESLGGNARTVGCRRFNPCPPRLLLGTFRDF